MDLSTLNNIKEHNLSLVEQIAAQINRLIIDQHLTEHDKLPTEFELMEILNVGRSTVREALKILVARNVLEIRRGKGTFVTKNPGINDDPLGFAYMQDKMKLARELLEVRTHIEPWSAYLAAQRATEADAKELCRYCDRVVDLSLQGKAHQDVDKDFHECVARCTHNRVICNLTPIIIYSVQVFSDISESTLRLKTNVSHRQICECICSHDPDGASKAVIAHLEANRDYWQEMSIDIYTK